MTGPEIKPDDVDLDGLFDDARVARPIPTENLMARIAADAALHQPSPSQLDRQAPGAFSRLLETLGGWPTIGGLVTATIAGVYIGFVQPELVIDTVTASEDGAFVSADLWPADAMFFEEG